MKTFLSCILFGFLVFCLHGIFSSRSDLHVGDASQKPTTESSPRLFSIDTEKMDEWDHGFVCVYPVWLHPELEYDSSQKKIRGETLMRSHE